MKLLLLAAIWMVLPARAQAPETITVTVGEHKAVTVTIPNVSKTDLVDLTSAFFGKGDEAAKAKFQKLFGDASSITLVLSTKHSQ